jgi:cytochrome b involved in lipid metabolism
MKRHIIILPIVLVLMLAVIYVLFLSNDTQNNTELNNDNIATNTPDQDNADNVKLNITNAELSTKNTSNECWTVINGKVYDITKYIPRHPGGDDVLLACGKDGTSLFIDRKTDSGESVGSGTPHSSSASTQLQSYYIGDFISE